MGRTRLGLLLVVWWLSGSLTAEPGEPEGEEEEEAVAADLSLACRMGARRVLQDYDADHSQDKVQLPILNQALRICIDENRLCEGDTYEWILLNIGGIHLKWALGTLAKITRQHEEYHRHAEIIPPLAAEQHEVRP